MPQTAAERAEALRRGREKGWELARARKANLEEKTVTPIALDLEERVLALEEQLRRLRAELLEHHHAIRPGMLNFVDKPVYVKDGVFVSLNSEG